VKKTQSLIRKGKTKEEALDIHNEIKIITSSDETFKLWSEVISSHSQGELYDPKINPLKKFKENKSWTPEKDRVLNREFFKWLENLSEANHCAFAKHILNHSSDNRLYSYPKVTMKTISSMLISYYSAKEWIERRKRKQLVRRELNKLKPTLGLFKANGEFNTEKWKAFKRNYNITSATCKFFSRHPGKSSSLAQSIQGTRIDPLSSSYLMQKNSFGFSLSI
jgi:hypothetical protein